MPLGNLGRLLPHSWEEKQKAAKPGNGVQVHTFLPCFRCMSCYGAIPHQPALTAACQCTLHTSYTATAALIHIPTTTVLYLVKPLDTKPWQGTYSCWAASRTCTLDSSHQASSKPWGEATCVSIYLPGSHTYQCVDVSWAFWQRPHILLWCKEWPITKIWPETQLLDWITIPRN